MLVQTRSNKCQFFSTFSSNLPDFNLLEPILSARAHKIFLRHCNECDFKQGLSPALSLSDGKFSKKLANSQTFHRKSSWIPLFSLHLMLCNIKYLLFLVFSLFLDARYPFAPMLDMMPAIAFHRFTYLSLIPQVYSHHEIVHAEDVGEAIALIGMEGVHGIAEKKYKKYRQHPLLLEELPIYI